MKIETKLLKPVVQVATRLACKKASLPILGHLLLDGTNGCLRVSATDIDLFLDASVEKQSGKLNSRLCIPAASFCAFVESAGEAVELEQLKNGRLKVKSGASRVREFSTLPAEEFVKAPDVEGMTEQGINAGDLQTAIEAVAWNANPSPASDRFWESTILVEAEPQSLKATTYNTPILSHFHRKSICGKTSFALPLKAVSGFVDALKKDDCKVLLGEKQVMVTHGEGFFSSSLPAVKWAPYAAILKPERKAIGSIEVEILRNCLGCILPMWPDDDVPKTIFTVGKGAWIVESSTGTENFSDSLAVEGNIIQTFVVNAKRLLAALRQWDGHDKPKFSTDDRALFMELGDATFVVGFNRA